MAARPVLCPRAYVLTSCLALLTGCPGSGSSENSNIQQASNLPPDPGVAGLATLQGIDTDKDGIRDDVQRFIALTYAGSAATQSALRQYGKALQSLVLDSADQNAVNIDAIKELRAIECMSFTRPNDFLEHLGRTGAVVLNTDERSRAYIESLDKIGGQVFSVTPEAQLKNTCNNL
jgi:hypothetical protein